MKKILAAILLITLINVTSFAKELSDVPKDHWAGEAVYGIVKYGVTQGFPDGTYRGTRTINRFELSILLWNMIQATEERMEELYNSGVNAETEKLLAELRAEIVDLKTELALIKVATTEKQSESKAKKPTITYFAQSESINRLNASSSSKIENRIKIEYANKISNNTDYEIKYDSEFQQLDQGNGLFGGDLKRINAKLSTDLKVIVPIHIDLTTGAGSNIARYNHYDDAFIASTTLWGFKYELDKQNEYNSSKLLYGSEKNNIGMTYEKYTDTNCEKTYVFFKYDLNFAQLSFDSGYNYDSAKWFQSNRASYQAKMDIKDVFNWGQTYEMRMTYVGKKFYMEDITSNIDVDTFDSIAPKHTTYRSIYDNLHVEANKTLFEFAINQNLWGWNTTLLSGVEHNLSKSSKEISSLYQVKAQTSIEKNVADFFFDIYWKNNVNGKSTDLTRAGLIFNF